MHEGSTLVVTELEVLPVRVSQRTVWLMVRLHTNKGLTGLGEASLGSATQLDELDTFFRLVEGYSPFDIQQFRMRAWAKAVDGGIRAQTAMSAIEQALWDLLGKALAVPVHVLMGGTLRAEIALYANINRMTLDRSPDGFARNARRVIDAGFAIIKAAPFDGFPARSAGVATAQRATDRGIDCLLAMREAVGDEVAIRVDCHSHFDFARAVDVARRLKPAALDWYEEPIAPTDAVTTAWINASIPQRMAGGELLFGVAGFAPLCRPGVVDVIMPDVMHCGGLLEGRHIAALAASEGVSVSPHNACGPVATAAAAQFAAGIEKFDSLELQWGEVAWRADITEPPEHVRDGTLAVPTGPGIGIELNDAVVRAHLASVR